MIETSPFLFESGGMFSDAPPSKGMFLDTSDGCFFKNPGSLRLAKASWVNPSGGEHLRYFSTSLSRNAGSGVAWGNEDPLRVTRLLLKAAKETPAKNLSNYEHIDLSRFAMQVKILSAISNTGTLRGRLMAENITRGAASGHTFAFLPSNNKVGLDWFANPQTTVAVGAETPVGPHGRKAKKVASIGSLPFYVDKGIGAVMSRCGDIAALNLPKSPLGGLFSHVNWETFPGIDLCGPLQETIHRFSERGSHPLICGGRALTAPEKIGALIEAWSCFCHSDGPAKNNVMKARLIFFEAGYGGMIETSGTVIGKKPEDWGNARKTETLKIVELSKSAGTLHESTAIRNLERAMSARDKKTGMKRGKRDGTKDGGSRPERIPKDEF